MSDVLARAEKYLEDFGSSSKAAGCLIQELIGKLTATNNALLFMTECHKQWSEMAIKLKGKIDGIEKQEPAMIGVFVGDECVELDIHKKMQKLLYRLTKDAAKSNFDEYLEYLDISWDEYDAIKNILKEKLNVDLYV